MKTVMNDYEFAPEVVPKSGVGVKSFRAGKRKRKDLDFTPTEDDL